MSDRLSPKMAANDLRRELHSELEQLDKDVYFAQQRNLLALFAGLSRIRTRIRAFLAALDRSQNRELRRNDHAPAMKSHDPSPR